MVYRKSSKKFEGSVRGGRGDYEIIETILPSKEISSSCEDTVEKGRVKKILRCCCIRSE